MNIGFFTDTYQKGFSGVETSINSFKKELEAEGHTVYIFAPLDGEKWNTKEENDQGIFRLQAMNQDFFPEFKLTFPLSAKVIANFGEFELDLIHSHTPFIMGFYANVVGFTLNVPVIHTYHTLYEKFAGHSFLKGKKTDKLIMNVAAKVSVLHTARCNRVIVPSRKMKNILAEYGITENVTVLPSGINLEALKDIDKDAFKKKNKILQKKKTLLFVGRIGREKNVSFLFDALETIRKKNKNVLLIVIGSGPAEDELKEEAKKRSLAKNVLFAGHKKREDVYEAYAGSDIFAFASQTDTQSLVIVEAAASGLPIVMLKDEGLIDLVKDGKNGFVVDTPDEFADATLRLLSSKKLHDDFSREAKEAASKYSIENQTRKLIKVYQETLKDFDAASIRKKMQKQLKREVEFKKLFDVKKNREFLSTLKGKTKELLKNLNNKVNG
ncbi:glycosyltransferase [Patescibacteria group bacterium]|nr:glycosyltransferase [Patescibacteria group bacterium]